MVQKEIEGQRQTCLHLWCKKVCPDHLKCCIYTGMLCFVCLTLFFICLAVWFGLTHNLDSQERDCSWLGNFCTAYPGRQLVCVEQPRLSGCDNCERGCVTYGLNDCKPLACDPNKEASFNAIILILIIFIAAGCVCCSSCYGCNVEFKVPEPMAEPVERSGPEGLKPDEFGGVYVEPAGPIEQVEPEGQVEEHVEAQ